MAISPNYRFHRSPRFSANHLAEYITTTTAGQREAVIRKAKFPRPPSVAAYSQASPAIRSFMCNNGRGGQDLDSLCTRLAAKANSEIGYSKDEAIRCISAIQAFQTTYDAARLSRLKFTAGPLDLSKTIAGVRVSVRVDAPINEEGRSGTMNSGGAILLLAAAPESRKNIEERQKNVAALIHWTLEDAGNIEPLPRLCMSIDAFGGTVAKAPPSFDRLRKTMEASCREACASWDAVEPPAGYDGPEWR